MTDHARQLERELSKAMAEIAAMKMGRANYSAHIANVVAKWGAEKINMKRELAEARAEIARHHAGQFCPYCNPCRRATEITPLEDALRSLAAYVGNGGFNSPTVGAAEYEAKIMEGIDAISRVERERAEKAEAECERLRKDAGRYRWLKKQRPQPMWASIPLRHQHMVRDDESAIDAAIDAAMKP